MAKIETDISHQCMRAVCTIGEFGGRLFKNVRGMFRALDRDVKIKAGLQVPGGSDLIGWLSITITPEMVGKRVAVFMAVESKTAKGYASEKQDNFIEQVRESGGIAGIARSPDDLEKLIKMVLE